MSNLTKELRRCGETLRFRPSAFEAHVANGLDALTHARACADDFRWRIGQPQAPPFRFVDEFFAANKTSYVRCDSRVFLQKARARLGVQNEIAQSFILLAPVVCHAAIANFGTTADLASALQEERIWCVREIGVDVLRGERNWLTVLVVVVEERS